MSVVTARPGIVHERAEDFHKSAEGFKEKIASESGDFWVGCGRLWIYQQNVNLSKYGELL